MRRLYSPSALDGICRKTRLKCAAAALSISARNSAGLFQSKRVIHRARASETGAAAAPDDGRAGCEQALTSSADSAQINSLFTENVEYRRLDVVGITLDLE